MFCMWLDMKLGSTAGVKLKFSQVVDDPLNVGELEHSVPWNISSLRSSADSGVKERWVSASISKLLSGKLKDETDDGGGETASWKNICEVVGVKICCCIGICGRSGV